MRRMISLVFIELDVVSLVILEFAIQFFKAIVAKLTPLSYDSVDFFIHLKVCSRIILSLRILESNHNGLLVRLALVLHLLRGLDIPPELIFAELAVEVFVEELSNVDIQNAFVDSFRECSLSCLLDCSLDIYIRLYVDQRTIIDIFGEFRFQESINLLLNLVFILVIQLSLALVLQIYPFLEIIVAYS